MSLTYGDYLALDELLSLQRPRSDGPEHDETLFIVVHQVYELWFKQILHETAHLQAAFDADDAPVALHTLKRILTILKTLVAQIDILETMTPISFLSFRARLDSASGFQSSQFREVEFVLGQRNPQVVARLPEGSEARRRLEVRLGQPSVWESFLHHLARQGRPIPAAALNRDRALPPAEDPEVQQVLISVYRGDPMLAMACERLVDLDEGLQEWRYRHVKMVERTIGTKAGTGGSRGAEYLHTTISRPLFPDLWAIRAAL